MGDRGRLVSRLPTGRFGLTAGDWSIGVALIAVVVALLVPSLRVRAFRTELAEAVGEVESLRLGASGYLHQRRAWPAAAAAGAIPTELLGSFPSSTDLVRDRYTLEWAVWEVVDSVEAPPPTGPPPVDAPPDSVGPGMVPEVHRIGGIVVYSADERLLAGLLRRYGRGPSFVRDTTWTLVLPERGGGS